MRRVGAWLMIGWLIAGGGAGSASAQEDWDAETPVAAEASMGEVPASGAPASEGERSPELPPPANLQEALTRTISMDFQEADLKDVLKLFSQQSGINFIASAEVQDRTITLFVDHVTVQDVLDQLLRANHLVADTAPESNILLIREDAAGGTQRITKIYKLRYARLSTSNLSKAVAGGGSAGATGGVTTITTGGGGGSGSGIDQVIARLLTANGALVTDDRTNSLIITDAPDNFPKLEQAIAELDVKTPQILIEAELLEVSVSRAKHLGIEWGTDADGVAATFTPATGATTRFPFTLFKGSGLLTSTQSRTITLGTLNTAQFQAVLKALQNDSDTRLLAHPKVLTLDNEQAIIELTAQTAIGQQVSTTATGGTGTTATTAERSDTGVKLKVTPQINADGYITMYVEPSLSRPVESEFFPGTFVDPKTRSASTVVRVRDGETIVIGGLIDRQDTKGRRKVPGLGNVPLVGAAFRKQEDTHSDVELIVFITPRIAADVDAQAQASALQVPLSLPPLAPEQQPPGDQAAATAREERIAAALDQIAITTRP